MENAGSPWRGEGRVAWHWDVSVYQSCINSWAIEEDIDLRCDGLLLHHFQDCMDV